MKLLFLKVLLLMSITGISTSSFAQETTREKKVMLYGDFRFRSEFDRNSDRMDGSMRDNRDRLRYRLRFGFNYQFDKNLELGGRIRSGNPSNQQSPHVTLGKEFHSDDFSIDKAYLKLKSDKGLWAWLGKNSMPFWEQNELLWDGDVNPEGLAVGSSHKLGDKSKLSPVFGYFIAGHSGKSFHEDSRLFLGQLKYNTSFGSHHLTVSSGLISGLKLPNQPDTNDTFNQDYNIWASSMQLRVQYITMGLDFFSNMKNYDNHDEIPMVFKDQKTGFVGSATYRVQKFQFSYYYAHIEKFAVVDYLAQDDWVRWGNTNTTRSSNFKGHELRIKYNINSNFNAVLRSYFVKGIETTGTHLESGNRIRLDLNMKF